MRQLDALVSVTPYKMFQECAPIKRSVRVHVEGPCFHLHVECGVFDVSTPTPTSTHHEDTLS